MVYISCIQAYLSEQFSRKVTSTMLLSFSLYLMQDACFYKTHIHYCERAGFSGKSIVLVGARFFWSEDRAGSWDTEIHFTALLPHFRVNMHRKCCYGWIKTEHFCKCGSLAYVIKWELSSSEFVIWDLLPFLFQRWAILLSFLSGTLIRPDGLYTSFKAGLSLTTSVLIHSEYGSIFDLKWGT